MYKETHARSIIKSISWRFWATLTTVVLVLIFVGEIEIALSIGFLEVFIKMFIYFFHERTWNKIKFGRHEIKPFVLWFTGLSGSGKRRISEKIYDSLNKDGYKLEYLNGETIRKLFPTTGFSKEERIIHNERVGYLASKLEKNGIFVIATFESPFEESRKFIKKLCHNYIEVYVSTPLEVCKKEDRRGLYAKAAAGQVTHVSGIDFPYEVPENPDVEVDISKILIEEAVEKIMKYLKKYI